MDVSTRAREGTVVIEVADCGPGLPASSEARVFEKFFRGKHSQVPGAGLGLTIRRGIVDAHDGTLVAENRSGGGGLFRITLPLMASPPSPPPDADPDLGRGDHAA